MPDAVAAALAEALAPEDDDAPGDPEADPLGTGVTIGDGLGDGKILLGTFANERAKIRTKRMKTIATQVRPRLSLRGGNEPRYPADGASEPRTCEGRR